MADKATKKRKAGGLKRWQADVRAAALAKTTEPVDAPIGVNMYFFVAPPKKPAFPYPATKPDIDKLARSVLDAMSGVVYRDDSRVVQLFCTKEYSNQFMGVEVEVCAIEKTP